MSHSLYLAIGAGMKFVASDINEISKMKSYCWCNWDDAYALAVSVRNMSFIAAYEENFKAKPFFAAGVTPVDSRGYTHRTSERARERLTIRSNLHIDGQPGEVTSITNDRVVIVLRECGEKMPRRILKLTHDDCRERWPAPKKKKATKEESEVAE
jgi:hypothetical protein